MNELDYYASPEELFDNGDAKNTLLDGYLEPILTDESTTAEIKAVVQHIIDSDELQDELINLIKGALDDSNSLNNYITDYDAYELGEMDGPWNTVIEIAEDVIEDYVRQLVEPSTLSKEFDEYNNLWD